MASHQPFHKRWFPERYGPQINIPFKGHDEFTSSFETPKLRERLFHFTADSIAKLKAIGNKEYINEISSSQSLSARVWRCVTRARELTNDKKVSCKLAINNRYCEYTVTTRFYTEQSQKKVTIQQRTIPNQVNRGGTIGLPIFLFHLLVHRLCTSTSKRNSSIFFNKV